MGSLINKRHQFLCRRKLQVASQTHQSLENFNNRLCVIFFIMAKNTNILMWCLPLAALLEQMLLNDAKVTVIPP